VEACHQGDLAQSHPKLSEAMTARLEATISYTLNLAELAGGFRRENIVVPAHCGVVNYLISNIHLKK
jgi:hypothetical protein